MAEIESFIQLNNLLRLHKGARGFLECQELVNQVVVERFAEVFKPAELGFELVVQNVLDMGKFATAAEIQVREHQKLGVIGQFYGPGSFSGSAVEFNNQSIRAAQRARIFLQKAREQDNVASIALRGAFETDETRAAIQEARGPLARDLVELTIKPEEFTEILQIWDEVVEASSEAEKLFTHFDNNLERFIARRQEPGRGTEPHSPLPWWKWFVIAAILCVAAAAVAVCVIYYECTYAKWVVVGAVIAIGIIVEAGC